MKHQFAYQPAPVDCIIFWGLIITGLGLTTVIQLELLGVSSITVTVGVITFACAIAQVLRYRIVITPTTIKLGRLIPGSTLKLSRDEVSFHARGRHTLTVTTQRYGKLTISTWRRAETTLNQLNQWLDTTK